MNKDRQFMRTRDRFVWNGHSFGVVKNPWDKPPTKPTARFLSPELLPSIFKDSKPRGWRRGQVHLNAPGDNQRFQYFGDKNNTFDMKKSFDQTYVSPNQETKYSDLYCSLGIESHKPVGVFRIIPEQYTKPTTFALDIKAHSTFSSTF